MEKKRALEREAELLRRKQEDDVKQWRVQGGAQARLEATTSNIHVLGSVSDEGIRSRVLTFDSVHSMSDSAAGFRNEELEDPKSAALQEFLKYTNIRLQHLIELVSILKEYTREVERKKIYLRSERCRQWI